MFLDEIGEMPKDLQVKLLRFLQERELRPLGSAKSIQVDLRVIAATNLPLAQLRAKFLREDFYFRVATVRDPAVAVAIGRRAGAGATFRRASVAALRARDHAGAVGARAAAALFVPRKRTGVGELVGERERRIFGQSADHHR